MLTLLTFVTLLLMVTAVPLALGRIRPNRLYGFRTPRTIADDRVWYPVNRMAGRRTIGASIVMFGLIALGWIGMIGTFSVIAAYSLLALGTFLSMFVSAASITAQVDAGGPRLDLSSSFDRDRKRDLSRDHSKLLDKLKR